METTTGSVRPTHTVQHLTRKNRSRPVFPRRSVSTPINEPKPRRPRYSHGSCREALCNCTAPLLSSNPRHLLNRASLSSTSRWIMTSTVSSARVSLQLSRSRGPARYVLPLPCPLSSNAPDFSCSGIRTFVAPRRSLGMNASSNGSQPAGEGKPDYRCHIPAQYEK